MSCEDKTGQGTEADREVLLSKMVTVGLSEQDGWEGTLSGRGSRKDQNPEAGVGWRVGKPTGGQWDGAEATGPEGEGGCGHWDLRLQNEQVERLARLALAASSNTNES